jgi:hypothetical protein
VAAATGIADPDKSDFFDHMFAEIDEDLRRQRDTMRTSSLGQNPEQVGLKAQAQNA